ncbi:Hypothetical predicted protein [Octopus vulgaris]|uniref:Uncharacterized protein n=1 Tax=Octopus vulgaris TaxID=6645 RepID=A0AA36AIN2_OCTVU|nr:Hypothetical predicted protein [Octopus vulgaris]
MTPQQLGEYKMLIVVHVNVFDKNGFGLSNAEVLHESTFLKHCIIRRLSLPSRLHTEHDEITRKIGGMCLLNHAYSLERHSKKESLVLFFFVSQF